MLSRHLFFLVFGGGSFVLLPFLSPVSNPQASAQLYAQNSAQSCQIAPAAVKPAQLPPDPAWGEVEEKGVIVKQTNALRPANGEQSITALAFSPDGQYLVSGSRFVKKWGDSGLRRDNVALNAGGGRDLNGGVEIWWNLNAEKWDGKVLYDSDREINSVAFSSNGQFLAAGGDAKGFVGLWSREQLRGKNPQSPLDQSLNQFESNSVAFSPDSRMLASGGLKGIRGPTIQLWDLAGRKLKSARQPIQERSDGQSDGLTEKHLVYAIAFSPDSKVLAGAGISSYLRKEGLVFKQVRTNSFVSLWDTKTGKYLCTVGTQEPYVISLAFSPDGSMLASGGADGSIKLWSLTASDPPKTLTHGGRVNAIAFSPSGEFLLSGSGDRTAKLWQAKTGQLVKSFARNTDEVTSVAFRPDGQAFAIGSKDNSIQLFSFPR